MIKALYLRHFRNYEEATFSFSPKINAILGENAQGKTNLLEAIYLLITGRSFRTPNLVDLICFGKEAFYIEALFEKNGIEQTLKFFYNKEGRKIIHNSTPLPTLSSLLGILHGIVISPEDSNLVKGGPGGRRQFLDLLIAQSNPLYLHHLTRYFKAMKQRNLLLKRKAFKTISVWEEQMAFSASFLVRKRMETVDELERLSTQETLASDNLSLFYRPYSKHFQANPDQVDLTDCFVNQFAKNRLRESELGSTLVGPHKDDLAILIHQKEARKFASEGQQRSCVTTLKLAQWRWLQNLIDDQPLLCIDDIGISFDQEREEKLFKRMESLGQVFITSARGSFPDSRTFYIKHGEVISSI